MTPTTAAATAGINQVVHELKKKNKQTSEKSVAVDSNYEFNKGLNNSVSPGLSWSCDVNFLEKERSFSKTSYQYLNQDIFMLGNFIKAVY